jgi:hypothetical protein
MRLQIEEVLLPAYRSFIKCYGCVCLVIFPWIVCKNGT